MGIFEELFKDKNADLILVDSTLIVKFWMNILAFTTDYDLYSTILNFLTDVISLSVNLKKNAIELMHTVLTWYSNINYVKNLNTKFKNTIFESIYSHNPELFSIHYCQSIELFLRTYNSLDEDTKSDILISDIFNNMIRSAINPSKSSGYAKIWKQLFNYLAIVGSNVENVNMFVSAFISLPSDIQDSLYSHFDLDSINFDSSKSNNSKKFSASVVYSLLKSFFKYGLNEHASEKDQLRIYTI